MDQGVLSINYLDTRTAPDGGNDVPLPPAQICLCDFESGDILRQLPCKHEFHQPCIDSWMDRHRTCPLCRHVLWGGP